MKLCRLLIIFILIGLSGCKLGPKYNPPTVVVPDEWKTPQNEESPEETSVSDQPCIDYWWQIFEDEKLNSLEEEAIANSPNLYVAFDKVMEARAIVGVQKAPLYPQVNLNPSYLNTGELFKIYLPPTGSAGAGAASSASSSAPLMPAAAAAAATSPFSNIPTVYRIHILQHSLPINMNYEIDLWGKLQGQYQSAKMSEQAQVDAYYSTLLTLTTDLAYYYYQLRSLDAQIELLQRTITQRKDAYDFAKRRYDKGLVGYSDVAQASVELTNAESEYYDAMRQRGLQENQIAVLTGVSASAFTLEPIPLYDAPPQIPTGLPSEILLRRPDILQAERQMAAQHELIGVAYASFFPSLSLTSTLGFISPVFRDFLKWKSRFWQFGFNSSETVFDGFRNESNLELAYANYSEARDNYKQQVLIAFREVEDALKNLEMQAKQSISLNESVKAAETSANLSESRYVNGITNYLEVIDTERTELDAQRNYISVIGNRYLSTVQLIKALGGGWACECRALSLSPQ